MLPAHRVRAFAVGVDALLYALTSVLVIRAVTLGGDHAGLRASLLLGVAALSFASTVPTRRRGRRMVGWFAAIVALWGASVIVDPTGVYLGFALFFVALERFRPRVAVPVVVALTVVVIAAGAFHQPGLGASVVIGPVIGAAVAIAMGLGYQSLQRENDHRRALIEELQETRDALAGAEHARGVLEERERLAREIHDTVAQGLASVVILLGAAEQDLQHGQAVPAAELVDRARSTAKRNLDDARRFVRELAPAALDDATLAQALGRTCDHACTPHLAVVFALSGEPRPMPPPLEVALLRVTQEALANVTAHASAGRCRVTLTFVPEAVLLDIQDDGRGFDPASLEARRKAGGFGLVAMRQRVEGIGGKLVIETRPGEGTVIAVELPTSDACASRPTPDNRVDGRTSQVAS